MNNKHTVPGYMVQLDGLRAIAVAIVILFHWTPEGKALGLGGLGVQLFFVLSGYLITGILLDARSKAETTGGSHKQIIKSFYARRLLRIFPLYYLVILVAFLLGAYNIQQFWPWHLSYLTNFAIFNHGVWIGEASHLWSLAVEEQFYMLWPFVILCTPKRYLTATVLGFILLAPIFKLTCSFLEVGSSRIGVLPISSFHFLGAGALLAILQKGEKFSNDSNWLNRLAKWVQVAGIIGLTTFVAFKFFPHLLGAGFVFSIVQEFAIILLFTSITMGAAQGYRGTAGVILASKPMVYIGQISYGLYLLHNFVPYFTDQLLKYYKINGANTFGTGGLLLLNTGVLLLLSCFCWHVLESRLNKYKVHFPYVLKSTKEVAAGSGKVAA